MGAENNLLKLSSTQKSGFRLFFLGDKETDIEIIEVQDIDVEKMKKRLKNGKNIFISKMN